MEQSWTTEQLRGTPPKYTLLGAKLHLITPPCPLHVQLLDKTPLHSGMGVRPPSPLSRVAQARGLCETGARGSPSTGARESSGTRCSWRGRGGGGGGGGENNAGRPPAEGSEGEGGNSCTAPSPPGAGRG